MTKVVTSSIFVIFLFALISFHLTMSSTTCRFSISQSACFAITWMSHPSLAILSQRSAGMRVHVHLSRDVQCPERKVISGHAVCLNSTPRPDCFDSDCITHFLLHCDICLVTVTGFPFTDIRDLVDSECKTPLSFDP